MSTLMNRCQWAKFCYGYYSLDCYVFNVRRGWFHLHPKRTSCCHFLLGLEKSLFDLEQQGRISYEWIWKSSSLCAQFKQSWSIDKPQSLYIHGSYAFAKYLKFENFMICFRCKLWKKWSVIFFIHIWFQKPLFDSAVTLRTYLIKLFFDGRGQFWKF